MHAGWHNSLLIGTPNTPTTVLGISEATVGVSAVTGDDEHAWRPRAANAEQRFPTRFSSSALPPSTFPRRPPPPRRPQHVREPPRGLPQPPRGRSRPAGALKTRQLTSRVPTHPGLATPPAQHQRLKGVGEDFQRGHWGRTEWQEMVNEAPGRGARPGTYYRPSHHTDGFFCSIDLSARRRRTRCVRPVAYQLPVLSPAPHVPSPHHQPAARSPIAKPTTRTHPRPSQLAQRR